jgi:hypothetical protein
MEEIADAGLKVPVLADAGQQGGVPTSIRVEQVVSLTNGAL